MTPSGDWHEDMERFALDPDTADRLLSGVLDPEDTPHRYGEVASLLRIAAGPTFGAQGGEANAVAAVVEAIRSSPSSTDSSPPAGRRVRLRATAAVAVGVLTLTGGLAAADALPGPAQEVAADALAVVGVHVPAPSDQPGTTPHPPASGPATTTRSGTETPSTATQPGPTTATTATGGSTRVTPVGVTSTANASTSGQPGASAGRTQPTTPTTAPPSAGAPQGAPPPSGTGNRPVAAPPATSSPSHQRQPRPIAGPEAPARGNGNGTGNGNGKPDRGNGTPSWRR